ncbi:MAG TPA: hypothetical protein VN130_06935 [Xanthobacteraceae bacterium]|nr:hypothetical protein [Xanthobacteraceae bacterium]
MELLIPPRHRGQFSSLKNQLTSEHTKCGPITWHGYLRIVTSDQDIIDQLKQKLDAQPI